MKLKYNANKDTYKLSGITGVELLALYAVAQNVRMGDGELSDAFFNLCEAVETADQVEDDFAFMDDPVVTVAFDDVSKEDRKAGRHPTIQVRFE